ncbi:GNAT family N-acetyltransferase [Mongoliimonas terrestris]|uniref:GNAT family N-acetyltransferase n=1 Tax=Mongoliimonas terrestris TaxID=1709001 RepID=UPI0009FAF04E|nr:GNAT family N-acetyltransferase [Mongoliimonas terrestris]
MSRPDDSGRDDRESIVGEAGERALVRPFHGLVIETRRLVLRAPTAIDAPAIAEIADNPHIAQNLTSLPHPYRTDDAIAWAGDATEDGEQKHLICLKRADGRHTPVGAISLDHRRGARLPTLGYWIGEAWWDRGFATEAAHAVIDYAFLHQGHARLSVSCRVTNNASRRVIEKCGFQMVAQELGHSTFFQAVVPVDRFQLDRRTWDSLRRWEPLRLAAV